MVQFSAVPEMTYIPSSEIVTVSLLLTVILFAEDKSGSCSRSRLVNISSASNSFMPGVVFLSSFREAKPGRIHTELTRACTMTNDALRLVLFFSFLYILR